MIAKFTKSILTCVHSSTCLYCIILVQSYTLFECSLLAEFMTLLSVARAAALRCQLNPQKFGIKHFSALFERQWIHTVILVIQPPNWVYWVSQVFDLSQTCKSICHTVKNTFIALSAIWWGLIMESMLEEELTWAIGWSYSLWKPSKVVAWLGRSQSLHHLPLVQGIGQWLHWRLSDLNNYCLRICLPRNKFRQ